MENSRKKRCKECKHFTSYAIDVGDNGQRLGRCDHPHVQRYIYDFDARNCDGFGFETKHTHLRTSVDDMHVCNHDRDIVGMHRGERMVSYRKLTEDELRASAEYHWQMKEAIALMMARTDAWVFAMLCDTYEHMGHA